MPVVEIFRYADIGFSGYVELGQPFEQRGSLGMRMDDGGYRLRGQYADTEGITVYTNEQNMVTSIRFDYAPEETLGTLAEAYRDLLGPSTGGSRLGYTQRIEWEDAVTRFELVYHTGATPGLYSLLSDRIAVGPSESTRISG